MGNAQDCFGFGLGASEHFSLAAIYPLEGLIADATRSYAVVLGAVGVAPLVGLLALVRFWPKESAGNSG